MTPAPLLFAFTMVPAPATGPLRAKVTVRADRPAAFKVSRRMWGKFTEHLGANVYQGAWAQLLLNPGCEGPSVWGNPWGPADESIARVIRNQQERMGIAGWEPALSAAAGTGFWWVPLGADGKYGLDAGVNGLSQRLWAPAGKSAGIATPVFVPVHRCREIAVELWAKTQAGARLSVALLPADRSPTPFCEAALQAGPSWTKCKVKLVLPEGAVKRGEACAFAIRMDGGGMAWVDQVLAIPADSLRGWDPDVVRYVRDAGVSLVRFPGGNFVSGYRWEDGVGPLDRRPVKPNPAWEGVEWNHAGTEEWLDFCRLVGAEPMICVNAGDGTPEEAARWVKHCRGRVKLWEVGNELYGNWQIGWTDAAGNAKRYAAFAKAMKRADPAISLIACGDTPEWNAELVKANGKAVRSISVHWLPLHDLPQDADPVATGLDLVADASRLWERRLEPCARPMEKSGLKPLLALDELQILNRMNAGVWEALFTSAVMNEALRHGDVIELLTHSALINHGGGLVKRRGIVAPQPVYWALRLYATQPGVRPLPVAVEGPGFNSPGVRLPKVEGASWLDAVALASADTKTVTVLLTNRSPDRAMECSLSIEGVRAARGELATFAPPSLDSGADLDSPDALAPAAEATKISSGALTVAVPAHAMARLVVRR